MVIRDENVGSGISGRRGGDAERGCRSRRLAVTGSHPATRHAQVPDIRWHAGELAAVRMDDGRAAMDAAAPAASAAADVTGLGPGTVLKWRPFGPRALSSS